MSGYTIIGAGQAGACAAVAMRKAGYTGTITLVGDEAEIPYERPPLSKGIVTGDVSTDSADIFAKAVYDEQQITLHTSTRVEAIEVAERRLRCSSGHAIGYEKLLIATGSRVRQLQIPGSGLEGVFYLRSMADTLQLKAGLETAKHLVVIGGGYLGLEVAASARKLGLEVTVLEREDNLLARVAPTEISRFVADLHTANGVDVRCGVDIRSIDGESHVNGVTLASGEALPADAVFIGVGGVPNVELAGDAGLEVDNGIRVNEYGETNIPGIYAAGDVTCHFSPWANRHLRLESWQVAQNQSGVVAGNMCGARTAYAEVPWFWSDQFDTNIQIAGLPDNNHEVVYRGEAGSESFSAFYFRQGRLVGAIAFNAGMDIRIALKLIERGAEVSPSRIKDTSVKLKSLLKR